MLAVGKIGFYGFFQAGSMERLMLERESWLDLQTQEQLCSDPPKKRAPPVVAGYSLVLLERGYDRDRVDTVVQSLAHSPAIAGAECPFVLRRSLDLTEALECQFELICADSISVFIDDAVLSNGRPDYLNQLFVRLRASTEFKPTRIKVTDVPATEEGDRFLTQFFGKVLAAPITQVVAYKKARIMEHWAAKLGVDFTSEPVLGR